MRVVSRDEMIAIDRKSINEYGISGRELMEEAGKKVAQKFQVIFEKIKDFKKTTSLAVVCGPGNNGGDGFVAARVLRQKGFDPQVFLLGESAKLKGDALGAFEDWQNFGGECEEIRKFSSSLKETFRSFEFLIDAIFGTGLQRRERKEGEERPYSFDVIHCINQLRMDPQSSLKFVLSVDLPSGMDADTGLGVEGADYRIKADATITLGFAKLGMVGDIGSIACGEISVVSLPFAPQALDCDYVAHQFIEPSDLKNHLKKRPLPSHKGDFGHVIVIGGSQQMPGALSLAVQGALRGGGGKVTAVVPGRDLSLALAPQIPEAMWFPLQADEKGFFHEGAAKELTDYLENFKGVQHAIVFGPGVGQGKGGRVLLEGLLRGYENEASRAPLVLDADALNLWSKYEPKPNAGGSLSLEVPIVMTPHPGELARLMNEKVRDIQNNRFAAITHAAKILNAWIVLKGYRTLLASPQDPLAGGDLSEFVRTEEPAFLDVNSTGNPAMATGGMGDVLAGLLGARLAQVDRKNFKKNEIIFGWREAIGAAIYIHGLAGDLAQKKFGDESLLPRDLIASIPEAFRFAIHGP